MTLAPLYRPFSPGMIGMISGAAVAGTAIYCLLYNWGQGTDESPVEAVGWAIANLLPWLLAFEAGKRYLDDPELFPAELAVRYFLLVFFACGASILLERLLSPLGANNRLDDLSFAFIRRFPAGALVTGLLLARRPLENEGRQNEAEPKGGVDDPASLPFLPRQIVWIKAAGNYLEYRSDGPTKLCRMTMKQAEQLLASKGFLRVHRSALVNGAKIAQFHRGKLYDEIQLVDGTCLRVGGAYRLAVAQFCARGRC